VREKFQGYGCTTYLDGKSYEGIYKLDRRHGFGVFEMADGKSHTGGFMNNKQHGYGCISYADQSQQQYGLWNMGVKIKRFTKQEASDIQAGLYEMESNDALNKEIEDPETFWSDIAILTNRFEPFDTFNME